VLLKRIDSAYSFVSLAFGPRKVIPRATITGRHCRSVLCAVRTPRLDSEITGKREPARKPLPIRGALLFQLFRIVSPGSYTLTYKTAARFQVPRVRESHPAQHSTVTIKVMIFSVPGDMPSDNLPWQVTGEVAAVQVRIVVALGSR